MQARSTQRPWPDSSATREQLINWLAWNDPSGTYRDADCMIEGSGLLSKDECWGLVHLAWKESPFEGHEGAPYPHEGCVDEEGGEERATCWLQLEFDVSPEDKERALLLTEEVIQRWMGALICLMDVDNTSICTD